MDEVRLIDGNALEQEMREFAVQIWIESKKHEHLRRNCGGLRRHGERCPDPHS